METSGDKNSSPTEESEGKLRKQRKRGEEHITGEVARKRREQKRR